MRCECPIPQNVREISDGLMYRDFITVGLLVNKLTVTEDDGSPLKDNWIYIQEPDVKVGRLQIFNNWSPCMVADRSKVWIGLEYFCNDTDELWKMPDDQIRDFAVKEVERIGILKAADVLDGHVVRVPKTYPAYFGTYERFDELRESLDRFDESFPGRPQRNAQVQQPGPLDADRDGRRREHHCRGRDQRQSLGHQHRAGIPRREEVAPLKKSTSARG